MLFSVYLRFDLASSLLAVIYDVLYSKDVLFLTGPLEFGGRSLGAVADLCWHPTLPNLLLSLHSPSSLLVLWDLTKQDAVPKSLEHCIDDTQ